MRIPGFVTISATLLPAIVFLLLLFNSPACGQSARAAQIARVARAGKQSPPADAVAKAAAVFKEALSACETKAPGAGLALLQEALRLWSQAGETEVAAGASLQMGDCYKRSRKYQAALSCYKQALAVKPGNGNEGGRAKAAALTAIARVYADLYDDSLARLYFDRALKQSLLSQDPAAAAPILAGLAELSFRQGDRKQALSFIARARQLNRPAVNREAEAAALHLIGRIHQDNELPDKAIKAFAESLSLYQRAGNLEGQVTLLCSLSGLHLARAATQEALNHAARARDLVNQAGRGVTLADRLTVRDMRARALLSLGRTQRAAGLKQDAINSFRLALTHLEGTWWTVYICTETSAAAFREEVLASARDLIDLLVEQGRIEEAYEVAERVQARAILALSAGRLKADDAARDEVEEEVRARARTRARLRTQLLFAPLTPGQRARLREIVAAEYALEEARSNAQMERFRDRLEWFPLATVKGLQEGMSPGKGAILQFFLGERRSFAWLLSSGDITVKVLPGREEIERKVTEYLQAMTTAPDPLNRERDLARLRRQAEELFAMLCGRLCEEMIAGQKLVVVPNGLLHYLPFESLLYRGRHLIEDLEISYVPSASMLGVWKKSGGRAAAGRMELLAIGDPLFGTGAKAPRVRGRRAAGDLVPQVSDFTDFTLSALPRTRDEVQDIAGLFPVDRRHLYLGGESTEERVKQGSLRRYRRLHLATHSLVNERSPSRSAVVLTLDSDPEEDGFLETHEISALDLDSDLVVLSACQTGRGQILSGEGILGLSRAFLQAGSRAVVVSLWNVTDASTARLMKHFYSRLAAQAGNAAALRQAKLQMLLGDGEARHPYYWAPFILIGEP